MLVARLINQTISILDVAECESERGETRGPLKWRRRELCPVLREARSGDAAYGEHGGIEVELGPHPWLKIASPTEIGALV